MSSSTIRPPFFLALLLLPIICVGLLLWTEGAEVELIEEEFSALMRTARRDLLELLSHEARVARYKGANPYFLEQQVESFLFCNREIGELQQLVAHPAVAQKQLYKQRLQQLTGAGNRLCFIEEGRYKNFGMEQTVERQAHPILIDPTELPFLLNCLSGTVDSSPQLIITHLSVRQTSSGPLELSLTLLKRTFE